MSIHPWMLPHLDAAGSAELSAYLAELVAFDASDDELRKLWSDSGAEWGISPIRPFLQKLRFPDLSSVATKTVKVPHTGNRSADFRAANKAAGYAETPDGMTWHHHQDGYTMQLVPSDIHRKTGHTGSLGIGNTPGKK